MCQRDHSFSHGVRPAAAVTPAGAPFPPFLGGGNAREQAFDPAGLCVRDREGGGRALETGVRGRRRGGARRGSLVGSSGTPGELPGGAASAVPWAGAAALPSLAGTAGIPKWALRTHAGKVRGRTTAEARTLTVKGDS